MRGAAIHSRPDAAAEPLLVLNREQCWEALYEEGDTEWLNVVIPEHGLGWVEAYHVTERNQELRAKNERVKLVFNGCQTPRDPRVLNVVMASVAHRLRSLEFSSPMGNGVFAIFKSCRDSEHSSLANSNLTSIHVPGLIEFLQSSAARQLTSLNLNNTQLYDEALKTHSTSRCCESYA